MGFNIQGLAVNKKFGSVQELASLLGLTHVQKTADTNFEAAGFGSKKAKQFFLTELEHGTIITVGHHLLALNLPVTAISQDARVLLFAVNETAMAYAFEYVENGVLLREYMLAEDRELSNSGTPLPAEATSKNVMDSIANIISDITGTRFWGIEPGYESEEFTFG